MVGSRIRQVSGAEVDDPGDELTRVDRAAQRQLCVERRGHSMAIGLA